jgi:hypothetical protein
VVGGTVDVPPGVDPLNAIDAVALLVGVGAPTAVGLFLILRRPRTLVAWILLAGALSVAVVMAAFVVAERVLRNDPDFNRPGRTHWRHSGGHGSSSGSGANGRAPAERRTFSPSSRTNTTGARSRAHATAASTPSKGSP